MPQAFKGPWWTGFHFFWSTESIITMLVYPPPPCSQKAEKKAERKEGSKEGRKRNKEGARWRERRRSKQERKGREEKERVGKITLECTLSDHFFHLDPPVKVCRTFQK